MFEGKERAKARANAWRLPNRWSGSKVFIPQLTHAGSTGGPKIEKARLPEPRIINAIPRFPDLGSSREKVERRQYTREGYQ